MTASVTSAWALSLGGSKGETLIGRPLDVRVSSSAQGEDLTSVCLETAVYFGDKRLPESLLRVSSERASGAATGAIRVQTTVPVNEPVVSVVMSVGCTEKFTRRYVLLADFEPAPPPVVATVVEPAPAPVAAAAPAPSGAAETPVADTPTTAPARVAPSKAPALTEPSTVPPAPVVRRPSKKAVTATASGSSAAGKPAQGGPSTSTSSSASKPAAKPAVPDAKAVEERPRLKLDPVDLAPVAQDQAAAPVLQADGKAPEAGAEGAAPDGATPAAEGPGDGAAPESARLAALEGELQGLRAQQKELADLVASLKAERLASQQRAEGANVWVMVLGVALALAVLALLLALVLLRRGRRGGDPWWEPRRFESVSRSDPAEAQVSTFGVVSQPYADSSIDSGVVVSEAPVDEEVEEIEATPSKFPDIARVDAGPTMPMGAALTLEDMQDLVQQVDFFESIGQRDDALDLLDRFIKQHAGGSELPYLMALRLAQDVGASTRRQAVEQRYLRDFGCAAPTALSYADGTAGVASDELLMHRLSQSWPDGGDAVLLQALTSRPGDSTLSVRTLEAYLDLVLLHAVAQGDGATSASATQGGGNGASLGWASAPNPALETAPVGAGRNLDLDLDLSVGEESASPVLPPDAPQSRAPAAPGEPAAAGAVQTEAGETLPPLDFEFTDPPFETGSDKKKDGAA